MSERCPHVNQGYQCENLRGHSTPHACSIPGFLLQWEPVKPKRKRVVFEESPDGEYRQVTVAGKLEMVGDDGRVGYCHYTRTEEWI